MRAKVWEVKMGSALFPSAVSSVRNVCAPTLSKAITKANKIERELCAVLCKEGEEKFVPDKAIAVLFLCELDE